MKKPEMRLEVLRFSSQKDSTLGLLFDITDGDRKFMAYTLEDEHRDVKVMHETRIPAGTYHITLRTVGGFHAKYTKRFGELHKGMLWLRNVPNFEYILIHAGNDDDDTSGCLLVGDTQTENVTSDGFVGSSVNAYKRIYRPIADAIDRGEQVTITYTDYDG
tara:strand:- start:336 stop:818 length:483 start_codon:yes stop_codon:yes gene_type:complete